MTAPTLAVTYADDGIALNWLITPGVLRNFHMPVDDCAGLPRALRRCASKGEQRAGTCWAVTPGGDDADVVLLLAEEIGAQPYATRLTKANARELADAVQQAIDDRDGLKLDLAQIDALPETDEPTP